MNILELLERIEFPETFDDCRLTRLECQECKCSVYIGEIPVHYPDCQLKAAIDALKSGRLVVVDKDYVDAVDELLEVANLRGDNILPHPADDPGLWTARMQTAWDDLEEKQEKQKEQGE